MGVKGFGEGGRVGGRLPCDRTFQGLHSVLLWTPKILTFLFLCSCSLFKEDERRKMKRITSAKIIHIT
jgi:hypothetical protein